jgi:uncharacterized LabA/DUF88 family protein
MSTVNRVAFLIDGFNLYHSLKSLGQRETISTKWLDVKGLCASYLYLLEGRAESVGVHYFSALASHLRKFDREIVERHKAYLECLTDKGVNNQMARFKKKIIYCPHCREKIVRYEEKETDVAISVKILELLVTDTCDSIVVLTGDTDVAPAIRTASNLFPQKSIYCLFPYDRTNNELTSIAKGTFQISKDSILRHQLSDPYICRDGSSISKPADW